MFLPTILSTIVNKLIYGINDGVKVDPDQPTYLNIVNIARR
jgi:hypothetical protein